MADTLARTLEDVQRLASVSGFYWVESHAKAAGPGWFVVELSAEPGLARNWYFAGLGGARSDRSMVDRRIIGPITPPTEEKETQA